MEKSAAIVLGGGLKKISRSGNMFYEPADHVKSRLDIALNLYNDKKVDYIITTGNFSKRVGLDKTITGPKTEAEVGIKYLIAKQFKENVPDRNFEDKILYENTSFDTLGNAWYAKKDCLEPSNITRCILITSDFHIERSKLIFKWVLGEKYNLELISVPTSFEGKSDREKLERIFINYFKKWLIPYIQAGDDIAIEKYFFQEHLLYSMSERSEALFNACMDTAIITAGY